MTPDEIDALAREVLRLEAAERAHGYDPPPCSCGAWERKEDCCGHNHDCAETIWYYELSVLRDKQRAHYRTAAPALARQVLTLRDRLKALGDYNMYEWFDG